MCTSDCLQKLWAAMTSRHIPRLWGPNRIPLHPESYEYLKIIASMGWKPFEAISIEEGKKQLDHLSQIIMEKSDYKGTIQDRNVPSLTKKGKIIYIKVCRSKVMH